MLLHWAARAQLFTVFDSLSEQVQALCVLHSHALPIQVAAAKPGLLLSASSLLFCSGTLSASMYANMIACGKWLVRLPHAAADAIASMMQDSLRGLCSWSLVHRQQENSSMLQAVICVWCCNL